MIKHKKRENAKKQGKGPMKRMLAYSLAVALAFEGCVPLTNRSYKEVEIVHASAQRIDNMYELAERDWKNVWINAGKPYIEFEENVLPKIVAVYRIAGRSIGYYAVYAGVKNAQEKDADINEFLLFIPDKILIGEKCIDGKSIRNQAISLVTSMDTDIGNLYTRQDNSALGMMVRAIEEIGVFPLHGGYKKWYNDCYDAVIRILILEDLGLKFDSYTELMDAMYVLTFEWTYEASVKKGVDGDLLIDEYKKKLTAFKRTLSKGNEKAQRLNEYITSERVLTLSKRNIRQFFGGLKNVYKNWWYPSSNSIQVKLSRFGYKQTGAFTEETIDDRLKEGDIVLTDDSPYSSGSHWGIVVKENGWQILNATADGYRLVPLDLFMKDSGVLFVYRKR